MNWSKEKTLQFIEDYKNRPVLWNANHPNYKCKAIRQKVLAELADMHDCHLHEVRRKITRLVSALRRSMKEQSERMKGFECEWYAFEAMSFLLPEYQAKQQEVCYEEEQQQNEVNEEVDETSQAFADSIIECDDSANSNCSEEQEFIANSPTSSENAMQRTQQMQIYSSAKARAELSAAKSFATKRILIETFNKNNEIVTVLPSLLATQRLDSQYDFAARSWALAVNRLPRDQQLLAHRLINEVLFTAQLGLLNVESKLISGHEEHNDVTDAVEQEEQEFIEEVED